MKTITIKQLIDNSNIEPSLIRATVKQFGGVENFNECYQDVCNHGIGGGFQGFIYYSDTLAFAKKHKKAILKLAQDQAKEVGIHTVSLLASFNCFKSLDEMDIEVWLAGDKENETEILNGLAWYAGEEVCRIAYDIFERGE